MLDMSPKNDELRTRNVFTIVFYFSATIMLSICFFALYVSGEEYLKTGRIVIGEALVNTEFPFHGIANLVTYLMITSVLSWFCITKLAGDKIVPYPNPKTPWNLVFATKMTLAAFLISAHGFYIISRSNKGEV